MSQPKPQAPKTTTVLISSGGELGKLLKSKRESYSTFKAWIGFSVDTLID